MPKRVVLEFLQEIGLSGNEKESPDIPNSKI